MMADITPEVSLTGSITPEVSIGGKVTVPEIVYLQGLQGEQGEPGPKGDTGAQGERGEKGDAFTYADFTEEQLAALKGPKGDTGAKGDKGDRGPQGEQGDPGESGAPGADGHTPVITAEKTGKVTTIKVDGVVVATVSDGVVSAVNSKTPDDAGNVALTGGDIPMSQDDGTTLSAKIAAKQSPTQNLDAETALADEDSFPFYDASASANKRTLWSNIVAKLKSLFLPLAGGTLTGIVTILKADDAYISIRNSTNDTRCALEAYNGTVGLYAGHLGKWLLKNDGTTTTVDNTIPATAGAVKAENLASDAVKLSFTNTSVAASQFVSDSTYTDFPYRALVSLSSAVTGDMIPEVVFNAADAASGIFAPVAQSTGGGIMLYASEKPSAAVTIPTIILWR